MARGAGPAAAGGSNAESELIGNDSFRRVSNLGSGITIMWRRIAFVYLLAAPLLAAASAPMQPSQEPSAPRIFLSSGRDLVVVKQRIAAGDKELKAALASLRKKADQ